MIKQFFKSLIWEAKRQITNKQENPYTRKIIYSWYAMKSMREYAISQADVEDVLKYGQETKKYMKERNYNNYYVIGIKYFKDTKWGIVRITAVWKRYPKR